MNEWKRAGVVLSEALEAGEPGVAADAAVAHAYVRLHTDPESSHAKVRAELDAAIRVFEEIGDEAGLARALSIGGLLRFWRGDAAGAIEEYERGARLARNAGDRPQEIQDLQFVLLAVVCGPTPVVTAREQVDDIQRRVEGNSRLEVFVMRARAQLDAMQGRFDAARELFADSNALAEERGVGALSGAAGEIELLAGDAPAAGRIFRTACEAFERRGDLGHFASLVPLLTRALEAQGRVSEAAPLIERAARWTLADDIDAQMGLLGARASLLADQGDLDAAQRLAQEAVELAAQTDYLNTHAAALTNLAGVLELGGRREEAVAAIEQALALYERKGNLVMAERTRERLVSLRRP